MGRNKNRNADVENPTADEVPTVVYGGAVAEGEAVAKKPRNRNPVSAATSRAGKARVAYDKVYAKHVALVAEVAASEAALAVALAELQESGKLAAEAMGLKVAE